MPNASPSKLSYLARYEKEKTRQFKLKLSKEHDADIIERLESVPNIQGYIKELIRADMAKLASS